MELIVTLALSLKGHSQKNYIINIIKVSNLKIFLATSLISKMISYVDTEPKFLQNKL